MDFRKNPFPGSLSEMAFPPGDRADTKVASSSRHARRAEQAVARRQKRREHHRLEQAWKHGRLSLSDCDFARRYLRGEVELKPAG